MACAACSRKDSVAQCLGDCPCECHALPKQPEAVDHPAHYGGFDNPYESIKVIRAWGLGFTLGNVIKYISRAGKKREETLLLDLKKARWYLDNEIEFLEAKK